MQLKEWFQLKLAQVFSFFAPEEAEPEDTSLVGQVEHLYTNFPYAVLTQYHQSKGIGVNVEAIYHNIGDMVEQINRHLMAMEVHGNPLPDMCRYEFKTVRFNKFILTKEGYYQPLLVGMQELSEAVLRLCKKIREGDTPDSITHTYTMRLLTPLLRHTLDVLAIVEEVNKRGP